MTLVGFARRNRVRGVILYGIAGRVRLDHASEQFGKERLGIVSPSTRPSDGDVAPVAAMVVSTQT